MRAAFTLSTSPYRVKLKIKQKETNKRRENDIPDIFQEQIKMLNLFNHFS